MGTMVVNKKPPPGEDNLSRDTQLSTFKQQDTNNTNASDTAETSQDQGVNGQEQTEVTTPTGRPTSTQESSARPTRQTLASPSEDSNHALREPLLESTSKP